MFDIYFYVTLGLLVLREIYRILVHIFAIQGVLKINYLWYRAPQVAIIMSIFLKM